MTMNDLWCCESSNLARRGRGSRTRPIPAHKTSRSRRPAIGSMSSFRRCLVRSRWSCRGARSLNRRGPYQRGSRWRRFSRQPRVSWMTHPPAAPSHGCWKGQPQRFFVGTLNYKCTDFRRGSSWIALVERCTSWCVRTICG